MHKWISTDSGDQCYRCGLVLDYGPTDDDGRPDRFALGWDREEQAAHALAPECTGPETGRAHHLVLGYWPRETARHAGLELAAYVLECAYGDATLRPDGIGYAAAAGDCIGDDPPDRYGRTGMHGPDGWCGETRPHVHGLSEGIVKYTDGLDRDGRPL